MATVISSLDESTKVLLILALFFIVKVLAERLGKKKDNDDQALTQNTHALIKLTTQFELFIKQFEEYKADTKKLKDDVNEFHRFKREVQKQI